MSIDSVGDFLTVIRNGIMAGKREIVSPYSRLKHDIARVLLDEGFINGLNVVELDTHKKQLAINLRYMKGESVIHEINRSSRPGRRKYVGHNSFKPVIGGLGISIVTTNRGVMTNKKARNLGVGGEVLCTVW